MLTLLAVAAGCVDAASFLGLGQVMTAAMTGNTILLGLALGQADVEGALRSTVALAGFVAGALIGAAIVQRGPRGVWAPAVTAAIALELMVLIALALAWQILEAAAPWPIDYRHPLIAAAGIAMGIQSAAAQRVGVPGITTTYITGTLTNLAGRLVARLRPSRPAGGDRGDEAGSLWLPASVWIGYGAGAVLAGAAHFMWSSDVLPAAAPAIGWAPVALLLPIAIVTAVILIAAIAHRRRKSQA
jgi:uncharacterized membrane protein YoaK (UPF0700 family)